MLCLPPSTLPSMRLPQSHQQLKEQLLQAAGVTGSVTESQHLLAGRLAALQLAIKQQRPQQAAALASLPQTLPAAGVGLGTASVGAEWAEAGAAGGAATEAGVDELEPCYPTLAGSDICCLGDVSASTCV
jgi:hypothetical protein